MIKYRYKLYWLLFLLTVVKSSISQTQQLKFSQVTGTNGISLGKINCIIQDKYGFIWLSDQSNRCIIRYDGTRMTRYQNDPKNPNTLGGFYPECLAADSAGNIWIGFYGMGLDKFDPVTKTFTHYRHKKNDTTSLADDFVGAIRVDHAGNVWVGNYGGLDLLDTATGTFKHHRNIPGDATSLSHNKVRGIYEDKTGTIWVATGFPWDPDNEGGLNRLNRTTGTFTRYMNDPKNPNSLISNKVRAVFEDSRGTLWIGTMGDGLHSMDTKTGIITRHTYNAEKPGSLSRPPVVSYDDHITFITEDAESQIWIGTLSNGIVRYDPVTNNVTHFGKNTAESGPYTENSSWWAYTTTDGLIWLCTQSAKLYKIDLFNNIIPHIGNSNSDAVISFLQESDSVFWFGANGSLIRKDLGSGTVTHLVHEHNNPETISNSIVDAMIKAKNGDLWFATDNGLNQYNVKTKKNTRYLYDGENRPVNTLVCVLEDKDSNIWAGSLGNGLYRFDPKTKKFTNYKTDQADTSSIGGNIVLCMLQDETGDLWIGQGGNDGLSRFNYKTGKFKRYVNGLIIASMYMDKSGEIWLGVPEGGLYRYDKNSDNFYSLKEESTGIDIHYISSITGDNDNNLWISTGSGIYQLNKTRDHAILFGKESGVAPAERFFFSSAYKDNNGRLYFGETQGYYAFDPGKLKEVNGYSDLYFTDFWLNDSLVKPNKDGPLKEPLFTATSILLNYNQNMFSAGFSSVDFRNTSNNNIYYKLENYDEDWRPAGIDNKVQYFKVPPGKYTLRIKASNSTNGKWVEKSIDIIISPPWWTTWWAFMIYALVLLALVFVVHRYQKERVIKAEREKARSRELAQAKEIEKAYHALRDTQAQLIQSEKMASLGELTAGIAHEIQNPLNFVNNFSDVNTELIDELQQELKKGNIEDAVTVSENIRQNEQKINHHGKRADSIVKGMLQHSRNNLGVKEPADINALCDEYLRLSYHGLRAKDKSFNAEMKTDFDNSIGTIRIIPQEIGRAILNLLNNAFYAVNEKKKTDGDGYVPTVLVSTKKAGSNVEIKISDNGNGIPKKILDKVFQPFFTTKPAGQGTGLGLGLTYDIVKAHGGEIKLETSEGQGTEFILSLPYQ